MEDRTVSMGRAKVCWHLSVKILLSRVIRFAKELFVPDAVKLQWPLVSLNTYSYDGKDGIWKVELQSHLQRWMAHPCTDKTNEW